MKNQLEAKQDEMSSMIASIKKIPNTDTTKSERISFPDQDAFRRSAPCVPQRIAPGCFSLGHHRLEQRAVESSEEALE